MNTGLLPNSTTTSSLLPHQSNSYLGHFLVPRKFQPTVSKNQKWVSLRCCSSSFRTRAIVGSKCGDSFYDLLGISDKVSSDDIKKAYKQMARKYHPDVSPPDRTEEYTRRFIVLHEAYETLSDPLRRAIYDMDLSSGLHFAFKSRNGFDEEELEERSQWRNRWQYQVFELQKKSMGNENSTENLSWGARMRRQKC